MIVVRLVASSAMSFATSATRVVADVACSETILFIASKLTYVYWDVSRALLVRLFMTANDLSYIAPRSVAIEEYVSVKLCHI